MAVAGIRIEAHPVAFVPLTGFTRDHVCDFGEGIFGCGGVSFGWMCTSACIWGSRTLTCRCRVQVWFRIPFVMAGCPEYRKDPESVASIRTEPEQWYLRLRRTEREGDSDGEWEETVTGLFLLPGKCNSLHTSVELLRIAKVRVRGFGPEAGQSSFPISHSSLPFGLWGVRISIA